MISAALLTTAGCAQTLLNDAEDDAAHEDENEAIESVANEASRGRFRWVLSCIDHRENDDRDENQTQSPPEQLQNLGLAWS